jgi:hypothetical protein
MNSQRGGSCPFVWFREQVKVRSEYGVGRCMEIRCGIQSAKPSAFLP